MDEPNSPTNEVFHYTNLNALCGILSSRSIWATHIRFLNDSREMVHGRELIRQGLSTRLSDRENASGLIKLLELVLERSEPNIFVACFSNLKDDLSQWRGYGPDSGVCIGFRTPRSCTAVSYTDDLSDFRIRRSIETCMTALNELDSKFRLVPIDPSQADRPNETDKEILKALDVLVQAIAPEVLVSSIMVKSRAFAAEDEMRLIEPIPENDLPVRVRFRVNRNVLTPYVAVPFVDVPVTRVILGPGPHSRLVADGVRLLLKVHGYEHVPVEFSSIPFRG
jgi:hypothetical protein